MSTDESKQGEPKQGEVKPFFRKPLLLGAHRGGEGLWPENTILAFTSAAKRWPNILLESDARLTADGHVVLIHDDEVESTTNGTGCVSKMTLAEVKKLDAGYRFTPDGSKTFPYRGAGLTVPTLQEVLAAVPDSRLELETKVGEGVVEATVKVIQQAGAEDRVLLASLNPAEWVKIREMAPRIATCYEFVSGGQMLSELRGGNWAAYQPTADCLSLMRHMLDDFKLTGEEIQAIRAKGVFFQIHTINDRTEMAAMLDLGADSILSDRPDVLAEVIAEWRPE